MASGEDLPRNRLSASEKLSVFFNLLPVPIVVSWELFKSLFSSSTWSKGGRRVAFDSLCFWAFKHLNRRQTRAVFGETLDMYNGFAKSVGMEPVIEDLGDGSRLLWVGRKRTDRVVLYFHGGAFLFGGLDAVPKLWIHSQENLEKKGKLFGVALLNYTLIPDATFPTTLKQSILAIQHLIKSGAKPENIILAGDSAGGAMVHGVLSHLLHPLEGVPKLDVSSPFAGAYLMSPWATIRDDKILYGNLNRGDIVDPSTLVYWASKVFENVPSSAIPYLEGNSAPSDWFAGVDKVVKRILISAGSDEILRDAVVEYTKKVEKCHREAQFFMDEGGVHVDPYLCFAVGQPNKGKLIPFISEWVDESFS